MLSNFIAWRYFRTRRTTHAINLIVYISIGAIAIVTAALVIVMSVFNGFEDLVKSLYGDFYADLRIEAAGKRIFKADDKIEKALEEVENVARWQPVLESRAVLVNDESKTVAWLKGVLPSYPSVVPVDKHLLRGNFNIGDSSNPGLVLGAGLENALLVQSDRSVYPVTVYLPNTSAPENAAIDEAIHSANVTPAGSFALQQEFDNQYAFTSLEFMQYMLDYSKNEISAYEIRLKPGADAESTATQIGLSLGKEYVVKTRYAQNQGLYAAMKMEKLIIFGVAFLILLIAAFNIISALTMTVLEKQQDIALLAAMGYRQNGIRQVFLKLAVFIAGSGALLGFLLGWLITIGQQHYKWVKLGGQSFVIEHYPMAIRWTDYLAVAGIIAVVSLIAGIFPARKASLLPVNMRS